METEPLFKVSSKRLEKPGIECATPGLLGQVLNHYTTEAPIDLLVDQMSHLVGKPTMWFPNRSDTNRPVQTQKIARSLKFWS